MRDVAECKTMMERVIGPACPKCGCQESELLRPASSKGRFRSTHERRRCAYCGAEFNAPVKAEPADEYGGRGVPYLTTRCPACGSARTPVLRTCLPVRYHRCQACGERFKSVE